MAKNTKKTKQRRVSRSPRFYPATIILTSLILSIASPVRASAHDACAQDQDFLVTAYYSPLPNQEHYYLGSYEKDITFNGRGIAGADGTKVYPGMIAAPEEYAFGTRIELPEIGVVGTVHDRGGRIVTGDNGTHRIDLWMGEGEEGLARALEWGAKKVVGKVYGADHEEAPAEMFSLAAFPAPESALRHLPSNPIALLESSDPRFGETSSSVAAIQYTLAQLGYFDHDLTSYFGDVTRDALKAFQRDATLAGNGEVADQKTRETLVAHSKIASALPVPLPGDDILLRGTSGKSVRVLQRVLSLLGEYHGELDGEYSQELMSAVYRFQSGRTIVQSLADTGAGMVGPQTRRALLTTWREHRIGEKGGSAIVASL